MQIVDGYGHPAGVITRCIILLLLVACEVYPKPPPRPFGVPRTAAWVEDGGVWVDCWRTEEHRDRFDCTIYTRDAKPHAKGRFLLSGDPEQPIRYRTWDGARLLLDGGRTLVRL